MLLVNFLDDGDLLFLSDGFCFVLLPANPADIFGGYLCFVISIFGIGCLTAVIGDVASHFGCTVGLRDAVTAVAFVALGTSVPGNPSNLSLTANKHTHTHTPFNSNSYSLRLTSILIPKKSQYIYYLIILDVGMKEFERQDY